MGDSWKIFEDRFSDKDLARRESLFSIGNGYLGFRGFFDERRPAYHPGVFINGFYELTPILYGEHAYGLAKYNQTMLDLPDCRYIDITIGEEDFCMSSSTVEHYYRELNFSTGILRRHVKWRSPSGISADMTWESLISLSRKHLGAMRFSLKTEPGIPIRVRSTIALPSERPRDEYDPRVSTRLMRPPLQQTGDTYRHHNGYYEMTSSFHTLESRLHLTCGALHRYDKEVFAAVEDNEFTLPFVTFTADSGTFTLEKCFYYHDTDSPEHQVPRGEAGASMELAASLGFDGLAAEQKQELDRFWNACDIEIDGDDALQRALRFNLFQLLQSTGTDGRTSLAAKGLTGGGYEGHYFWDTEIYGMPFFTFTCPDTARSLVLYRISILERARERSQELSQRGALFPWRTINGLEASAYYPAGTAQYHINADIAYSIFQYIDVTGDRSLLTEGAAELLFETARLWADLGFFNPRKDDMFCINEVTGPDEYSALVNNNFYTNAMAKYHLMRASDEAEHLKTAEGEYWNALCEKIGLKEEEISFWREASRRMYLPYDTELGIHPQDDSFLQREPWDFAGRPKEKYPLLLYYHPLVIYRYQVLKQADAVLALLLLHDQFPWYQRKRDFSFYEPLTTGDSSLSACIQGIVAFDCGDADLGMKYCRDTSLMDIEDLHRNTKDGLHTAAMAGSWMSMVFGIGGFRMEGSVPRFRPQLPESWKMLKFRVKVRSSLLTVTVTPEHTIYQVSGPPIILRHRSRQIELTDEVTVETRPALRGVIFDLDGVITSTDEFHYRAWKMLADREGWDFDHGLNMHLRGVSRRESLMIILRHNQVELDEATVRTYMDEKNRAYRESLHSLTRDDILPGIEDLLSQLKLQGIQTAVASASRNAGFILKRLELEDAFDFVVPAQEVVRGKPDCEVFARAADALGLFPEECAGIEDAAAGIESIKAAMMTAVGVGEAVTVSDNDLYVPDTASLRLEDILKLFE